MNARQHRRHRNVRRPISVLSLKLACCLVFPRISVVGSFPIAVSNNCVPSPKSCATTANTPAPLFWCDTNRCRRQLRRWRPRRDHRGVVVGNNFHDRGAALSSSVTALTMVSQKSRQSAIGGNIDGSVRGGRSGGSSDNNKPSRRRKRRPSRKGDGGGRGRGSRSGNRTRNGRGRGGSGRFRGRRDTPSPIPPPGSPGRGRYRTALLELVRGGSDDGENKNASLNDVWVVQKADQRSGKKTRGKIQRLLTKSPFHPRGIKVMLTGGIVGRVSRIVSDETIETETNSIRKDGAPETRNSVTQNNRKQETKQQQNQQQQQQQQNTKPKKSNNEGIYEFKKMNTHEWLIEKSGKNERCG